MGWGWWSLWKLCAPATGTGEKQNFIACACGLAKRFCFAPKLVTYNYYSSATYTGKYGAYAPAALSQLEMHNTGSG